MQNSFLQCAADEQFDIFTALLESDLNIDEVNNTRLTTLQFASNWDRIDLVHALLAAGAVDSRNDNRRTTLLDAAYKGRVSIVRTLLWRGANIDDKDLSGQTALQLARVNGHLDLIDALEEAEKDANAR